MCQRFCINYDAWILPVFSCLLGYGNVPPLLHFVYLQWPWRTTWCRENTVLVGGRGFLCQVLFLILRLQSWMCAAFLLIYLVHCKGSKQLMLAWRVACWFLPCSKFRSSSSFLILNDVHFIFMQKTTSMMTMTRRKGTKRTTRRIKVR